MDFTSRLLLRKPNSDPVTGDDVNVDDLNFNFDKLDSIAGSTVCTSSTRPPSPFPGQIIVETDTGKMYIRSGSAWIQIVLSGGAGDDTEAQITVNRPAPRTVVDHAFRSKLVADSQYRFLIKVGGGMQWGDGVSPPDTNLYRGSVGNQLRTDNDFVVAGALRSETAPLITDAAIGTVGTASTTEAVIRTLPSRTYKNQRAYEWTCRAQINGVAALGLLLKLRKGTLVSGAILVDYGRIQVTQIGTDVYCEISGTFRNTSGADITTQLVVTAATTTSTCAIKGFGSGAWDCRITELYGGAGSWPAANTLV